MNAPDFNQPPVTALIADDDPIARGDLVTLLGIHWPELRIVAEIDNGADAWDRFLEHAPGVCFLDMRMPGLTGIEVAERIRGQSQLVLMAKMRDPALDALRRLGAIQLVKPFDMDQAVAVIESVRDSGGLPTPIRAGQADVVRSPVRRSARINTIPAALGPEAREVTIDDIVYLEADGASTRVVQEGGDVRTRLALKELVPQLDPREFWQIHRHIVVNRRHVERAMRLQDGGIVLTLKGRDEQLPVGAHFLDRFKESSTL